MDITPEMIATLDDLLDGARKIRKYLNPSVAEIRMADAIDVLDNADFFAPITNARES